MSSVALEENGVPTVSNDPWSVAEGTKNGNPLLIRFRNAPPQGVEPAELPFLLSATWGYKPDENGLPSAEEMERMNQFVDALTSSLEESGTAYLMVALTGSGERDWLWYTSGEEPAMRQVNRALQGHPRYPIQFSVQRDPAWRAYFQFVRGETSPGAGKSLLGWIISKALGLFRV